MKMLFICDGRDESCELVGTTYCYKNGGTCKYTEKLSHAKHFYIGPDPKSNLEPDHPENVAWIEEGY